MSKEQGQEEQIPEQYRWDELVKRDGEDLQQYYKQMLLDLGDASKTPNKKLNIIYANATTSIKDPKNLYKIIHDIDDLDWLRLRKKAWARFMKGSWKRTPMKPSQGQASTLLRGHSST